MASMNGYIAIYKGKRIEVSGPDMTKYQAMKQAAVQLKVKPGDVYKIDARLCEQDGQQVVHFADF